MATTTNTRTAPRINTPPTSNPTIRPVTMTSRRTPMSEPIKWGFGVMIGIWLAQLLLAAVCGILFLLAMAVMALIGMMAIGAAATTPNGPSNEQTIERPAERTTRPTNNNLNNLGTPTRTPTPTPTPTAKPEPKPNPTAFDRDAHKKLTDH